MHLWAMGRISSTGLQELASAAASDGLDDHDLAQLAGIGTFGEHPDKCHRDFLRMLGRKLKQSNYGGLKES